MKNVALFWFTLRELGSRHYWYPLLYVLASGVSLFAEQGKILVGKIVVAFGAAG